MKKESGFTLIEVMIVVAIIGILAAIIVPQFIVGGNVRGNTAHLGREVVKYLVANDGECPTLDQVYWQPKYDVQSYQWSVEEIEGVCTVVALEKLEKGAKGPGERLELDVTTEGLGRLMQGE